ncbi:MAG: two-component regulator propeller domain-containing protein, partial [Nitrospira sp.]
MVILLFMLACCGCAFALNPSLDISQYAHKSWKIGEGVASGTIHNIAQSKDGYLWLATEAGLVRFDGVNAVTWRPPKGEHLPSNDIRDLLASRDGTLWLGTAKGLASWMNGKLIRYPQLDGYDVNTIREDHEGTVWAAGVKWEKAYWAPGRLCTIKAGTIQCYGSDGIFGFGVTAIHEDRLGNLWLGAANGLWRWKPGPPQRYELRTAAPGSPTLVFSRNALIDGDTGGLIITGFRDILRFVNGRTEPYPFPSSPPPFKNMTMLRDRGGSLWISSTDVGLVHVHQGRMDVFTQRDGLTSNSIESLFEDREGSIWVATNLGIDRFREYPIPTISTEQGLSSAVVTSVLAARDGSVWLGTSDGLNRWKDGQITIYRRPTVGTPQSPGLSGGGQEPRRASSRRTTAREVTSSALPENFITSLFQDTKGRIWVSTFSGLAWFENGKISRATGLPFTPQNPPVEDTAGNIWSAQSDRGLIRLNNGELVEQIPWAKLGIEGALANPLAADLARGGVWVGSWSGGVVHFRDGQVVASYGTREGLGGGRVNLLQFDSGGRLWAATDGGLSWIRNGRVTTLTATNGLPCDIAQDLLEDETHALWVHMACGLVRIPKGDSDAWAANPALRIQPAVYDASDGVISHAGVFNFGPRAAKTADGKLWFSPTQGVMVVDPRHLPSNPVPTPVHIEHIKADGETLWENLSHAEASNIPVPALTRRLEIGYTALSLVAPEKVRFKYKLEGYDGDWHDADNRRQAFYNDLSPRNYRFRVIACNNSGLWNETGATLEFSVAPAYYQTSWFVALCAAAFLALLWGAHQVRTRQLQEQEKKFREAVETMPALAFVASPEGYRTFVNRGWIEYTGLTVEQASGYGWHAAVHPDDLDPVIETWRRSAATGEALGYEARLLRGADGAYRWFEMRAAPLRDKRGKLVKWCGVATDIEDRKRAEQERERLRQLEADLAHINRVSVLGELTASIAHEVNQPLAGVVSNANAGLRWLAADVPDLEEVREGLRDIVRDGKRAGEVIARIRALTKRTITAREKLDLNETIREVLGLVGDQLRKHGVIIRTGFAEDLSPVAADRVQLQQVVLNLVVNAIEAMSSIAEGSRELTITTANIEPDEVQVTVEDSGVGIDPEK